MPKTKIQKQETIKELKQSLEKAKSVVFANIQGLKAKDLVILRRNIKQAKGVFKVAKKTLIDLAFGKDKTQVKDMQGEIAVAFSNEDEISPLKAIYNFAKENESLKILAGIFNNAFSDKDQVLALAQLPSKQELLAKLVGSLSAPMTGFNNVLQGNIKGLIYLLNKIKATNNQTTSNR